MSTYVPKTIHLVLTHPPEHVSDEDFEAWYRGHLPEILRIPGWIGAEVYKLETYVIDGEQLPYRYAAMYTIEGNVEQAMKDLATERHSGCMDLPDWFEDFEAGSYLVSWNALGLEGMRRVA